MPPGSCEITGTSRFFFKSTDVTCASYGLQLFRGSCLTDQRGEGFSVREGRSIVLKKAVLLEVESFAADILRSYFCESDVEFMISTFSDDIVWLGAGEKMKAEGAKDVGAYFRGGKDTLVPCDMYDERYISRMLGSECYLCECDSWLVPKIGTGLFFRTHQRATFIFQRIDGVLKTVHIHNSVPYSDIKDNEMFPVSVAKEAYERLQHTLTQRDNQIELMLSLHMAIVYQQNKSCKPAAMISSPQTYPMLSGEQFSGETSPYQHDPEERYRQRREHERRISRDGVFGEPKTGQQSREILRSATQEKGDGKAEDQKTAQLDQRHSFDLVRCVGDDQQSADDTHDPAQHRQAEQIPERDVGQEKEQADDHVVDAGDESRKPDAGEQIA